MNIPRIVKIIIAVVIAIVLTAGFLYVKLKVNRANNQEDEQQIMVSETKINPDALTQAQLNEAAMQLDEKDRTPLTKEQLEKAAEKVK